MKKKVKCKNRTDEDRISDIKYVLIRQLSGTERRHYTRKEKLIKTSRNLNISVICYQFLVPIKD